MTRGTVPGPLSGWPSGWLSEPPPAAGRGRHGPGARGRLLGAGAAGLGLLALAACGGGEPTTSPSTITVTVPPSDPSDAAAAGATTAPSTAEPSATAEATGTGELPRIDRGFDAAYVTEWREEAGGLVLSIDRLTVAGLSDDELAASGATVAPHAGDRFVNQSVRFYEVGVSDAARWVLTTCETGGGDASLTSLPVPADDFLATPGLTGIPVLVAYREGLVDRIETNPAC